MHTQIANILTRGFGILGFIIVLGSSAQHGRPLVGALQEASWAMLALGGAGMAIGRLWCRLDTSEDMETPAARPR